MNEVRCRSAELQSHKGSAVLSAVPAAWLGLGLSPASVASHNPSPSCLHLLGLLVLIPLPAELHPGEGGCGPRENEGVGICSTALAQHLPCRSQSQLQETNAVTAACDLEILMGTMKLINANQK